MKVTFKYGLEHFFWNIPTICCLRSRQIVEFLDGIVQSSGNKESKLIDQYHEAGYYEAIWKDRTSFGNGLPYGIYITRLTTPEYNKSIKMVLLK
ncbi:hypothetical protein ACFL45_04050 [Candidatus Neomarinimicrobiota bacterium]